MRILIAVFTALLLSACGAQGVYYEKSPDEIAAAIENAVLPTMGAPNIIGSTVTRPSKSMVVTTANDEMGGDVFRIVTTLTEGDGGTYVDARFEQLHKTNSFAAGMADKFAQEHVASVIEGRSFDMMFATAPAIKAVATANPEVAERIKASGDTMVAFSKMQQDMGKYEKQKKFDEEYGDDWAESSESDSYSSDWGE